MKDKEFDDIGKRLYDLEADPPKDGWKKLKPEVTTPQAGTIAWLRKNWWIPLTLLIPVAGIVLYSGFGATNVSSALEKDSTVEQSITKEVEVNSLETKSADLNSLSSVTEKPVSDSKVQSLAKSNAAVSRKGAAVEKSNPETIVSNLATKKSESSIAKIEVQEITDQQADGPSIEKNKVDNTRSTPKVIIDAVTKRTDEPESVGTDDPKVNEGSKSDGFQKLSDAVVLLDSVSILESADNFTEPENELDSASTEVIITHKNKTGSVWRLTASVKAQYLTNNARPVVDDEVLVTKIGETKYPERIGLGFALGAGVAITRNFYVDGQISYTGSNYKTSFSSATGKVDTLIAVQQPDQSVVLMPVYAIDNGEIEIKQGYGGIRLGGTYYFLTTPRSRFNINVVGGAHYRVSGSVKEKIDGQWISISDQSITKTNYSVMVGAGYNINLNRGWELMINPGLTYYSKKVQHSELPFNLNQRTFDINVMLSKTLRKQ